MKTVNASLTPAPPGPTPPGHWDWHNPPFVWRVVLVGIVWAVPGALGGLMAYLVVPLGDDPSLFPALGASVSAMAGAGWEAFV